MGSIRSCPCGACLFVSKLQILSNKVACEHLEYQVLRKQAAKNNENKALS